VCQVFIKKKVRELFLSSFPTLKRWKKILLENFRYKIGGIEGAYDEKARFLDMKKQKRG
jgi:hypothetical protein